MSRALPIDNERNTPRIYSDKNLSFSNENLRYWLEIMSCVVVNGNREKQVFILAKVGFVSNIDGCEKLHNGFRFSIKVNVNPYLKTARYGQNIL
jgi:hypothetical protein